MKAEEQIRILQELIEGVKELNDEFQDGWDDTISDGKKLLKHLKSEQ